MVQSCIDHITCIAIVWWSHWCPCWEFPYSDFDHFVAEVEEVQVLQVVVVGLHSSVSCSLSALNNSCNNFKTKYPMIQPFHIELPVSPSAIVVFKVGLFGHF